jgi:hypothetical protein
MTVRLFSPSTAEAAGAIGITAKSAVIPASTRHPREGGGLHHLCRTRAMPIAPTHPREPTAKGSRGHCAAIA